MTLVQPERSQENLLKGPDLDALLQGFDDFAPDIDPDDPDSAQKAQEAKAVADSALDGLVASVSCIAAERARRAAANDAAEQKIDKDVMAIDQEHRFTFSDLETRLPFAGFSLRQGEVIISDDIFTHEKRKEHIQAVRERNRRAETYGLAPFANKNGGTSAARELLETELLRRSFSKDAIFAAQLALTELVSNTGIHGGADGGIAGRFEARFFPESDQLVMMAINATSRPNESARDSRAPQTGGRGLSLLAGLIGTENLGKLRAYYSPRPNEDVDKAVERLYTYAGASLAGLGRTATFAIVDRKLQSTDTALTA